MTVSLQPLTARVRAKLGWMRPIDAVADETVELAPALRVEAPAIIQLPDELDRVVAFNATVTREAFLGKMHRHELLHPPTIAHRYARAVVANGAVFAHGSMERIYQTGRVLAWTGTPEPMRDRMLATSFTSELYFGHWLLDGISLELLAAETGHRALGLARTPWLQEPDYRARTGLALQRTALAEVEDLWLVDDRPINLSRVDRMTELRRRVRGTDGGGPAGPPVFLRRVAGVKRRLVNQDALADALARRGFVVLTPEEEPVETLVAALARTDLVVSVRAPRSATASPRSATAARSSRSSRPRASTGSRRPGPTPPACAWRRRWRRRRATALSWKKRGCCGCWTW